MNGEYEKMTEYRKQKERADMPKWLLEGRGRLANIAATKAALAQHHNEDTDIAHQEAIGDWDNWLSMWGEMLLCAIEERTDKIAQLRVIANVNGDWSLKYGVAVDALRTIAAAPTIGGISAGERKGLERAAAIARAAIEAAS